MVFFNKNGQAVKNSDSQVKQVEEASLDQLETTIQQLVKKIELENEKNQRVIKLQKNKLEQLQGQMQTLLSQEGNYNYDFSSGRVKGFELEQLGKKMAKLSEQISQKRHEVKSLELDIAILERSRDEESIGALVQAWKDYETKMFSEFISPLELEITAAKAFYFEKLKQLRSKYNMLEGLTVHLTAGVLGNEPINIYNWVNSIHNKPQLLITKDDELKEFTIMNTYRAE
ncbi:hypothetical protein HPT25_28105 [Bacillus sp. BRMEA1]|uniref:hypothetical protein n=1 Tax=Neobacillus endophyticus TaxID=2738405 RepID=UPI0015659755|nr:hypothetical protein [Neobacillus endophyticus]NRD81159.1 hypothetical protein [Neobacillus endophyticus]